MSENHSTVGKIVVAGLIHDDAQKVLVALRSPEMSSPGLWELPGGKVEPGEGRKQALRRELMEEIGIDTSVKEHLGMSRVVVRGGCLEMHVYRCEIVSGRPMAKEHSEIRWISSDMVEGLTWAPADTPLLGMIQEEISKGD